MIFDSSGCVSFASSLEFLFEVFYCIQAHLSASLITTMTLVDTVSFWLLSKPIGNFYKGFPSSRINLVTKCLENGTRLRTYTIYMARWNREAKVRH